MILVRMFGLAAKGITNGGYFNAVIVKLVHAIYQLAIFCLE